jgi:hypothetical protein
MVGDAAPLRMAWAISSTAFAPSIAPANLPKADPRERPQKPFAWYVDY